MEQTPNYPGDVPNRPDRRAFLRRVGWTAAAVGLGAAGLHVKNRLFPAASPPHVSEPDTFRFRDLGEGDNLVGRRMLTEFPDRNAMRSVCHRLFTDTGELMVDAGDHTFEICNGVLRERVSRMITAVTYLKHDDMVRLFSDKRIPPLGMSGEIRVRREIYEHLMVALALSEEHSPTIIVPGTSSFTGPEEQPCSVYFERVERRQA